MPRDSDSPVQILPRNVPGLTSEERLRLVLSAVRAGVWEADFARGTSSWSQEMFDIYGCDPQGAPSSGSEFADRFVYADDRQQAKALFAQVFVDPELTHYDFEFRAIRPDGSLIWVSAIGHVRRGERGEAIFAVGIHRDISERKRAELARVESAEYIQMIAAVTPDPFYVFDLDEQRRVYGNRAMTETLGYGRLSASEDAAVARTILHPADRETVAAFRRTVLQLRDGEVAEVMSRFRRADGTWRWFLTRNSVFARKPDGRVYQIVGTAIDVTEHKAIEEELRTLNTELEQRVAARTAELTGANKELEAFVHSVSHDLRGPLRSIDGFSQLLLSECAEQLDDQARHFLSRIVTSAARLHELMDALLALSRASRGQLQRVTVNLSELARTIAADLQRLNPARDVRFVIADDISATADQSLMRIVLENLIENAWKFTHDYVQARIELGVQSNDREPIYFVEDNGVGFDMAYADKVFAPFQRLHGEEQFPGTGIGLATVHRIVERHGGRIWVESAIGCGTIFYFTLGMAEAAT